MTVLSPSEESDSTAEKLLSYNRANRAVAILCNHQRAPPKTFNQSMANLQAKVRAAWTQSFLTPTQCRSRDNNVLLSQFIERRPA